MSLLSNFDLLIVSLLIEFNLEFLSDFASHCQASRGIPTLLSDFASYCQREFRSVEN
jgi:hypothetical protein